MIIAILAIININDSSIAACFSVFNIEAGLDKGGDIIKPHTGTLKIIITIILIIQLNELKLRIYLTDHDFSASCVQHDGVMHLLW